MRRRAEDGSRRLTGKTRPGPPAPPVAGGDGRTDTAGCARAAREAPAEPPAPPAGPGPAQLFWKTVWQVLAELNRGSPREPAPALLGVCSAGLNTSVHAKAST